jgi:hypothetical protein
LQFADKIALASLVIAIVSFFIALVALAVSMYATFKSNRNSSVATLVTLSEAFREAWSRFIKATRENDNDTKYYELAELMNLFEIACGIQLENSLSGMSMVLIKEYLEKALGLLISTEYTNKYVPGMLQDPLTFCNIKRFINSRPKYLSVTIPPSWYQFPCSSH